MSETIFQRKLGHSSLRRMVHCALLLDGGDVVIYYKQNRKERMDSMRYSEGKNMKECILPTPKKNQTVVNSIKFNPKNLEHINAKLNYLKERKLDRFEQHGHGWLIFMILLNTALTILVIVK